MARRKRYILADFPEAGTVFAMPLSDGRVGVCRVLRKMDKEIPCALIAASDWISNEPPPLNHPAVQRTLLKNHHNWANTPEILWVTSPPPPEFRVIGNVGVTAKDTRTDCGTYAGWDSLAIQVLAQWRWDNEREAVLAEDKSNEAVRITKRKEAIQKRAEYLSTITFSTLLARDLFPRWDDYPPEVLKTGCQNIIHSCIRVLEAAERPLKRVFVSRELRKCIEAINQLNSQQCFIETIEREDLCEVLEDIVNAAKFPDLVEEVDKWRDW